ncbi:DUF4159 domain-containing protein [Crateriforma conspicua]|uniref:Prenyltransferase and squalene oxidase repeat protein n=1 Tax=Crateriforma conspicua TaxID=2527996 RepID=A0A5C5YBP8_9PLAN|nr:DUF4159 domain-containing protein [Crateriforma conspicua]TWT72213.1 Prenyltransferase and squalene oxidase repeat protein [Crateriforma conspicua]
MTPNRSGTIKSYFTRRHHTKPRSRRTLFVRAVVVWAVVIVPNAALGQDVDAVSVQRSIDRGVAYLKQQQTESGGWPEYPSYSCGLTALCTLALLNADVPPNDPAMVSALAYLRRNRPDRTYPVALQTLAYCEAGAAEDLPRIRRNVDWLVKAQNNRGLWSYTQQKEFGGDPSNSQFALLALAAAVDRGVRVPEDVFAKARTYWLATQQPDGGWRYRDAMPVTGSMTCAGIASLIITEGRMAGANSSIQGDKIQCCGGDDEAADPVQGGLGWLARYFSTQSNPQAGGQSYYYYMYALERVGRLSGRRFIGQHDWYREGADRLLRLQDSFQGFWRGSTNGEDRPLVATSFALLFLSKGKRQVVVGRLQYSSSDATAWNRHPESLRQLVRHVERDWGKDLTWQTIRGENARVTDLLQAPVLVISGRQAIAGGDVLADRLGEYVDQGGTILFEAEQGDGCGDAAGFRRQFADWVTRWYPDSKIEKLPIEHPVWYAQRKVDPEMLGKDFWIYGVQACCRTPIFFVPKSLSCRWELSGLLFRQAQLSESSRSQISAAVSVGENVIAYATGRELQDKLQQRFLLTGSTETSRQRGQWQLAELALGAGGEDARRALPNAVGLLSQTLPVAVAPVGDPITLDDRSLSDVTALWVHGRTDFQWTAAQRKAVQTYLDRGGYLIANAVCGAEEFVKAFRREIDKLDLDEPLAAIAPDHPALTNRYGGFDVRRVTIRRPKRDANQFAVQTRTTFPMIEAARVGPADNVFFSPLDLSCALESQNSIQCAGYGTEDATRIIANLLLYAMQQPPAD